jgi:hypothetical protein
LPSDNNPDAWLVRPKSPEAQGPGRYDASAWHYTNAAGLTGIINGGVLWACSTSGLNDSEEVFFGIEALSRLWDRVKPALVDGAPTKELDTWLADIARRAATREVLVVCACADGNSLLHWQTYARIDEGYAIEFSPTAEFKLQGTEATPDLFQPDDVPAIFWRDVTYGEKDPKWDWQYWDPTRRLIEGALDAFSSARAGRVTDESLMLDLLDRQYLALVYAYKHGGFEPEHEKRLIVVKPPFDGFTTDRATRYGPAQRALLVPVEQSDPEAYSVRGTCQLPILSVQLAPRNPKGDEERVRALLENAGYPSVPVHRSGTPIR